MPQLIPLAAAGIAAAAGASAAVVSLVATAASLATSLLFQPKAKLQAFDPKSVNTEPGAYRKMLLGRGLFASDLRYFEASGSNQEYVDYVFVLAAHKSQAVEEIWIDDKLAWASGSVGGTFAGFLDVEIILEAGPSAYHTVNGGWKWGSSRRLTGCTTAKLRVRRTTNGPFNGGLAGKVTFIGKGMPLYDPRFDSTNGGSGPQRPDDCSTWVWSDNAGAAVLSMILGWTITNPSTGAKKVSVGYGVPFARVSQDIARWAAACAACDEAVAKADGTTEARYRVAATRSDGDDPLALLGELTKACAGELDDSSGAIALRIATNDLSGTLPSFGEADVTGAVRWTPQPTIAEQWTVVRGRYSEPVSPSLWSPADYQAQTVPRSTAGGERALVDDLLAVPSKSQAERLARMAGQRSLYAGVAEIPMNLRATRLKINDPFRLTFGPRAWTNKLFRVRGKSFRVENGQLEVIINAREENAAVFAWDRSEAGAITPVSPVIYSPLNNPLVIATANAANVALAAPIVAQTQQLVAQVAFDFSASRTNGFIAASQVTIAAGPAGLTATTTGTDPYIVRPSLPGGLSGAAARYVRILVSTTSSGATASAARAWQIYYATAAHGFSASYYVDVTLPSALATDGSILQVLVDMWALTVGGSDWQSSIITDLRIDLGTASGISWRILEVSLCDVGAATAGAIIGTDVRLPDGSVPAQSRVDNQALTLTTTGTGDLTLQVAGAVQSAIGRLLADMRALPPISGLGVSSKWPSSIGYTANATAGTFTVNVGAATVYYGTGLTLNFAAMSGTFSQAPGTGQWWFLYCDLDSSNPYPGGTMTRTLVATTNDNELLQGTYRVCIGRVFINMPSTGTGSGSGLTYTSSGFSSTGVLP